MSIQKYRVVENIMSETRLFYRALVLLVREKGILGGGNGISTPRASHTSLSPVFQTLLESSKPQKAPDVDFYKCILEVSCKKSFELLFVRFWRAGDIKSLFKKKERSFVGFWPPKKKKKKNAPRMETSLLPSLAN